MKQIIILIITAILLLGSLEEAEAQSVVFDTSKNYVLTRTPLISVSDVNGLSSMDCLQSVEYMDEWGRSLQNIQIGITPSLQSLATYQEYDNMGNPSKYWIPVLTGTRASFLPLDTLKKRSCEFYNGDVWGYSLSLFESSPLRRLEAEYEAGEKWVGDPSGHEYSYEVLSSSTTICRYVATNGDNDTIVNIQLMGMYNIGDLLVVRDYNEDHNVTITYTDKLGHVILKEYPGHHCTYYVYDDNFRLRAILPPQLSDSLVTIGNTWSNSSSKLVRQYAYLYTYDGQGRCSHKRLPGISWTYYYYDQSGQLILSQDGNMRKKKECMFTIPDAHGRIVLQGLCKNICSFSFNPLEDVTVRAIRNGQTNVLKGYQVNGITLSSPTVQVANYYDDYEFMDKNGVPAFGGSVLGCGPSSIYGVCRSGNPTSFQTGQLIRLMDDSYIYQAMYYDERGRMIQHHSTNHLGGSDRMWYAYNFSGDMVESKHVHTTEGGVSLTEYYTYYYDHGGRLASVYHQLDGGKRICLISNTYDELGRVSNRQVHDLTASSLNYTYNIRSWLMNIKGNLFSQSLEYVDGSYGRYSGDITGVSYRYGLEQTEYSYDLEYDMLDRLINAEHWKAGQTPTPVERVIYDKNSNILGLQRYGQIGVNSYGFVDELSYTYDGNQLKAVNDTAKYSVYDNGFEFKDGAKTAVEYVYDANGNLIKDLNKNIIDIQYNYLNLPSLIQFGDGSSISYLYDANGVKLQTTHVINGVTTTTDYCGNLIYENGVLGTLLTNAGYITFADKVYHYYLQDHQGNNCVVIDQTGEIEEMNRYYPFGGIYASSNNAQHYKYNGKKLDANKGLNWYDYGARHYDAALCRWHAMDPLAEKYDGISPYVYCGNNPVNGIDPDGRDWYQNAENENEFIWRDGNKEIDGYTNIGSSMSFQIGTDSYLNFYQNAGIKANQAVNAFDLISSSGKLQNQLLGTNSPLSEDSKSALFNGLNSREIDKIARPIGEAMVKYGAAEFGGIALGKFVQWGLGHVLSKVTKNSGQGGLNLFKWGAEQTTKSEGWKTGDYMLYLPDKGSPKLNWKANYSALRREMGLGKPIYDSYRLPNGGLIPTGGFLNAERFTLQTRGWTYSSNMGAWLPPIK